MVHPAESEVNLSELKPYAVYLRAPLSWQPQVTVAAETKKTQIQLVLDHAFFSQEHFADGEAVFVLGKMIEGDTLKAYCITSKRFFSIVTQRKKSESKAVQFLRQLLMEPRATQVAVGGRILASADQPVEEEGELMLSSTYEQKAFFSEISSFLSTRERATVKRWLEDREDNNNAMKSGYFLATAGNPGTLESIPAAAILERLQKAMPYPGLFPVFQKIALSLGDRQDGAQLALIGPDGLLMDRILQAVADAVELTLLTFDLMQFTSEMDAIGCQPDFHSSSPGTMIKNLSTGWPLASNLLVLKNADRTPNGKESTSVHVQDYVSKIVHDQEIVSPFLDNLSVPLHMHMILTAYDKAAVPSGILGQVDVVELPAIGKALAAELIQPDVERLAEKYKLSEDWITPPALETLALYRSDFGIDSAVAKLEMLASRLYMAGGTSLTEEDVEQFLSEETDMDDPVVRFHLNEDQYAKEIRSAILTTYGEMARAEGSKDEATHYLKEKLDILTRLIDRKSADFDRQRFLDCTSHLVGVERILREIEIAFTSNTPVLLVGPPGNGKSSVCRAIAKAIKSEAAFISLCEKRTADLVGVRPEFKNSEYGTGLISQAMASVRSTNPLIALDEIDKLGRREDSFAENVLIQLLDDSQKDCNSFFDEYLQETIPCSPKFIATANSLEPLSAPLLNRFTVVRLEGYTPIERQCILTECFLPDVEQRLGTRLELPPEVIESLVRRSALSEGGVRDLKHNVHRLAVAWRGMNPEEASPTIQLLDDIVGPEPHLYLARGLPGSVNGLAVGGSGAGCVMPIQCTILEEESCERITGGALDGIEDSIRVAQTWLASRGISLKDKGLHIHFLPAGVKKDGPSAGLAIAMAMLSAVKQIPIPADVAFTGEFDGCYGILPVGGLKQKLSAAYVSGIQTVYVPEDCRSAVPGPEHFPGMQIKFVSTIDEVVNDLMHDAPKKLRAI